MSFLSMVLSFNFRKFKFGWFIYLDKCSKRNNVKRNLGNYLGLAIWKSCTVLDPYLAGQFLLHHIGYDYSTYLWLDNWHLECPLLLKYGH